MDLTRLSLSDKWQSPLSLALVLGTCEYVYGRYHVWVGSPYGLCRCHLLPSCARCLQAMRSLSWTKLPLERMQLSCPTQKRRLQEHGDWLQQLRVCRS